MTGVVVVDRIVVVILLMVGWCVYMCWLFAVVPARYTLLVWVVPRRSEYAPRARRAQEEKTGPAAALLLRLFEVAA